MCQCPVMLSITHNPRPQGSDRDSAEKMERLFGEDPARPRVLAMPGPKRVADRTADKDSKARVKRASK